MPGPYIRDGHYMYGNAFIQPYPAYYNSSWYHRKPPRRFISDLNFVDDGCLYMSDPAQDDEAPITRSELVNKIINIETLAFRSLRIKLYALKEEDDTDLVLEIGKQYAVTYLSEGGLKVANGILKIIDSSIPDECIRYIGQFNETVATAWIGMDCSTAGRSDKRKIFVASIRAIEEVPIDDESYIPPEIDPADMGPADKLNLILSYLPGFTNKLDQILYKVADNDEIMDKLAELDPAQKLNYIISKLDDPDKFNSILEQITASEEAIKENTSSIIGDHNTAVINEFANTIQALGNMDYVDKINYIYMQMFDADEQEAMSNSINTIKDKQDAILNKLEEIYNNTKPEEENP